MVVVVSADDFPDSGDLTASVVDAAVVVVSADEADDPDDSCPAPWKPESGVDVQCWSQAVESGPAPQGAIDRWLDSGTES